MMAAGNAMTDLKDLEPLAARLNPASDELTRALETIQEKLNRLALGVEAWVTDDQLELSREVVSTWDRGRTLRVKELGYAKRGEWMLVVRTMNYVQTLDEDNSWDSDSDIEDGWTPLLRTSRELRVAAVGIIPKLIEELRREAARVLNAVESAKHIAKELK